MRRAAWLSLLLVACSDPDFVECDGGMLVEDEDGARCAPGDGMDGGDVRDAGDPTDAGRDAATDGGPDASTGACDGADAPDCFHELSCFEGSEATLVLDPDGATERTHRDCIDAADHAIPVRCGEGGPTRTGADRDFVRLEAPVRSIVEIEVARDDGGLLEPVVFTHADGLGYALTLTGSTDPAPRARTLVIQHAPPPEPTYVGVRPFEAWDENLCTEGDSGFRGGDAYGYTLTARLCESCAIRELGAVDADTSVDTTLAEPGALTVVRLTAAPSATVAVSVASHDCGDAPDCCPVAVPLDPGSRDGSGPRASYENPSTAPAGCEAPASAVLETNPAGERLFAIYDFDSRGAPGYDVSVDVEVTP